MLSTYWTEDFYERNTFLKNLKLIFIEFWKYFFSSKYFSMGYYDIARWGRGGCQILTEFSLHWWPYKQPRVVSLCPPAQSSSGTEERMEGARKDPRVALPSLGQYWRQDQTGPDQARIVVRLSHSFVFSSLILTFNTSDGQILL